MQWLKRRGIAQGCAFWGYKIKKMKFDPYLPQNTKNLALNRQFPAKMMEHETPSISESTEPIEVKI